MQRKKKRINNNGKATSDKFSPIANPYLPDDLESGDWFYLADVIDEIKEIFNNHPVEKVITIQGNPGTGKSSTLTKIEKQPELLGQNFIPIYLDSRKYSELVSDDILFSVYKDVAEKMGKYGINISSPNYFIERRIADQTPQSYIMLLDSLLPSDKILLLMLDEFDNLLENTPQKNISTIISFFSGFERDWDSYRIIFAGERRLSGLAWDKPLTEFLESAYNIDVEEALKEEDIKKLIIEPVGTRLTFDDNALERIIWFSGKNLYFQQLLCHFIVNYMNKENRTLCTPDDVEQAAQQIINKSLPEFDYAWKSKLLTEAKLIASALADNTIMVKKKNFQVFKANSLLNGILGENLHEEIEKLQNYGYLSKLQGKRFSECPFKIPLYGNWIGKKHPFIKTVIESIDVIASRIKLGTIFEEIKSAPAENTLFFDKESVLEVSGKWLSLTGSIKKSRKITDKLLIEDFLESFAQFLDIRVKGNLLREEGYSVLDIKKLAIGMLNEAMCIIPDKYEMTQDDGLKIERIATTWTEDSQTQTKLTLILCSRSSEVIDSLNRKPHLNLVVFKEDDLKIIFLSPDPQEAFRKIILKRLSLILLSPYITAGPSTAIFYGRKKIIDQILRSPHSSFSIVGPRKIGKSSLLYRINEYLPTDTICVFLSLESLGSINNNTNTYYKKFFKLLEKKIGEQLNSSVRFRKPLFSDNIGFIFSLREILSGLSQQGKRVVFIFDEIDELLEIDRKKKFALMNAFRAMAQDMICRFIFAGFKELHDTKREHDNPMYNFCSEIILGPLDDAPAIELIKGPMERIGIHYANNEDLARILSYTSRHPNLLQFFCKELVLRVELHPNVLDRRTVYTRDIEELFNSKYEDYILNDIYMFHSGLSLISRLILLQLVENKNYCTRESLFSLTVVMKLLEECGISLSHDEVHKNLRELVIRFVIRDMGKDNYRFALPSFPEMLTARVDSEYKTKIIKEIKRNDSKPL